MRKVILFTLLSLTTFSAIAQSFEANPTSISVPRYANQTAISAANANPVSGTLVYNNALNQFSYYNGTAWVNFPSASSTPPSGATLPVPVYPSFTPISNIPNPTVGSLTYDQDSQDFLQWDGSRWRSVGFLKRSGPWNVRLPDISSMFIGAVPPTNPPSNSLTVQGFTRLGDDASPLIKTKLITGTTNGGSSDITTVPHGLNAAKIISITCSINGSNNLNSPFWIFPSDPQDGFTYKIIYNSSSVNIQLTSSFQPQLRNKPYSLYITYIP